MGIYDNWIYTDLHQLNLDWILKEVKKLSDAYGNIVGTINNTIAQMIADGTLVLALTETYDAATESLTLSIGGQ